MDLYFHCFVFKKQAQERAAFSVLRAN